MIFGFNTDVKHGDTIYHVQSEAREGELLLQTQVFVRGRCIGKKATSYAAKAAEAQFGDAQKEQQLREQHRLVLDAIREGKLDNVLDHPEAENLAAVKELDVQWLNAESVHANRNLTMQLRVTEAGARRARRAPDLPLCPSRRGALLHPGGHRCQRRRRDENRGRGNRPPRFVAAGASQLPGPHRNPQIRPAKGGVVFGEPASKTIALRRCSRRG